MRRKCSRSLDRRSTSCTVVVDRWLTKGGDAMGRISEQRVLILERQTADLHRRLTRARGAARPERRLRRGRRRRFAVALPAPRARAGRAVHRRPSPRPAPPHGPPPPPRRSPPPRRAAAAAAARARSTSRSCSAGASSPGPAASRCSPASRSCWRSPSRAAGSAPPGRTLVAGALSLGLIGAGAWLYEHRRRTDAALATLSAGLAGLFITVTVGGPVYGVLPAARRADAGLRHRRAGDVVRRPLGVARHRRARDRRRAAGARPGRRPVDGHDARAAVAGGRLRRRRPRLAALELAGPGRLRDPARPVGLVDRRRAALGRRRSCSCSPSSARSTSRRRSASSCACPPPGCASASALLLTANATTLALAGWYALDEAGATTVGRLWIGALAAAHIGVGLATRATRINRDIRMLALLLGAVLADITAGLMLEGAVLAGAFAITTAGFAVLARRVLAARDAGTRGPRRAAARPRARRAPAADDDAGADAGAARRALGQRPVHVRRLRGDRGDGGRGVRRRPLRRRGATGSGASCSTSSR